MQRKDQQRILRNPANNLAGANMSGNEPCDRDAQKSAQKINGKVETEVGICQIYASLP